MSVSEAARDSLDGQCSRVESYDISCIDEKKKEDIATKRENLTAFKNGGFGQNSCLHITSVGGDILFCVLRERTVFLLSHNPP